MVNIINELEQRNKNLLEENEVLKKQLVNKEESFKLKIYNAIHNVMKRESPDIAGTLMTLQQHFWSWDEWVKVQKENGVEKVIFGNNFTLENVVKGFSEWTLLNCDSYSYIYQKNEKLKERDSIEITDVKKINLKSNSAEVLIIEVPM